MPPAPPTDYEAMNTFYNSNVSKLFHQQTLLLMPLRHKLDGLTFATKSRRMLYLNSRERKSISTVQTVKNVLVSLANIFFNCFSCEREISEIFH